MVSAAISTIFAEPDGDAARTQLRDVVDKLSTSEPKVAERLQAMEDDLLAYTAFPPVHWSKLWSNNPISVNRLQGRGPVEVPPGDERAGADSSWTAEDGSDGNVAGGGCGWRVAA